MPLYEYECKKCRRRVEKIQKYSDPILTICESCGGKLERLVLVACHPVQGFGLVRQRLREEVVRCQRQFVCRFFPPNREKGNREESNGEEGKGIQQAGRNCQDQSRQRLRTGSGCWVLGVRCPTLGLRCQVSAVGTLADSSHHPLPRTQIPAFRVAVTLGTCETPCPCPAVARQFPRWLAGSRACHLRRIACPRRHNHKRVPWREAGTAHR